MLWFNVVHTLDGQIEMEKHIIYFLKIVFYDGLEEAILSVAGDIG
jgi:hypothetical protein